MKPDILLFGGTTEGRQLCDWLEAQVVPAQVYVATEYGEAVLKQDYQHVQVHIGRLDREQMVQLFRQNLPALVLDATHPYAVQVTENLRAACAESGADYCRIVRPQVYREGCHYFSSEGELIAWLKQTPGVLFSTLGSKELPLLKQIPDYESRLVVRVLPSAEAMELCSAMHLKGRQVIAMQGPFSTELNRMMFAEWKADILITKESGTNGGFPEKIEAAQQCGMQIAVLQRPQQEQGVTVEKLQQRLADMMTGKEELQ